MNCEFKQRDEVISDYVEGTLQPHVRKKFEAHYFLCRECFTQLQRLEQIIPFLRREGETIFRADHSRDRS